MSIDGVRRARLLLLILLLGPLAVVAGERTVDRATMQQLSALRAGRALQLDAFPTGPNSNTALRFERVEVYAPDAHIYVMTAGGKQEVPRSNRIFLRGVAADGSARLALSLNADGSFAEGNGAGPEGAFALEASKDASGTHTFSARRLESTLPSPDAFQMSCGSDKIDPGLSAAPAADLAKQLREATNATASAPAVATSPNAPQTVPVLRIATIAIDTDSEFMSRLFSNSTSAANNWIAGMFNSMNAMYEGDLKVHLQIGTTFLRTSAASDPYTGLGQNTSSNTADLNLFGNYWRANETGVTRSFAILLSGAIPSVSGGCSASGIAWIDQYCQKGFTNGSNTVGSYSVTKVCTSIAIDPHGAFDALIVGHEIGHNFGAFHTHCTNLTNGSAPVATNTIDTCYNQEGGAGCYTGATSCPAGGSGTIMSYCNFTSVSGCASGTQNQPHFHPTQVTVLLTDVAANTPSCLANDDIFPSNFGG